MRSIPGSLLLVTLLSGCSGSGSSPVGPVEPDHVLIGVHHNFVDDGVLHARVTADSMHLFVETGVARLYGVRSSLIGPRGEETAELRARQARVEIGDPLFHARDRVRVDVRGRDLRIEGTEVHLHPRTDRIWSEEDVTLYEDGQVRRMEGFSSDMLLRGIGPFAHPRE